LEMSEQYDKRRRKSKILKNIIIIGGVICVILAVSFSFYTQYQSERFKEQKERAEKSEFISKLNYARSAIENEDYKSAKETLEHNPSIVNEFPNLQNIRNLLTWSTELQGATFQREYKEKMLAGGLWTLTIQDHLLATGGDGGTIVIFDTEEAKQLKSLTEHDNTVKSVLFHPFKNQLISAGYDGKVISWSLSNDEPKLLFEAQSPIWTMAINSRGGLIIGERDNTIAFLKMDEDGKEVVFRQKTDGAISKLAISPTGEFLASSSYNRSVQIWKKSLTPQGAEQQQKEIITPTWTNSHSEEVESIAFNLYGTQLASTSRDKTIRLWKVDSGKLLHTLEGHQGSVFCAQFTFDGDYLVSGAEDNTLRLWDVDSGVTLRVFQGHQGVIRDLVVEGKNVFSASSDGTVKRWLIHSPHLKINGDLAHKPFVNAIAPDGSVVAVGSEDGVLQLFALSDVEHVLWKKVAHAGSIRHIAFSHDGHLLATASSDNTVKLWQVNDKELQERQ
ncbi:MAG: WD40 repeat domain-containing protein, partial [Pseudomonadota bacterium]|nr:WD40 repeat domain-containing protein [Pseudomonadota bacterium]